MKKKVTAIISAAVLLLAGTVSLWASARVHAMTFQTEKTVLSTFTGNAAFLTPKTGEKFQTPVISFTEGKPAFIDDEASHWSLQVNDRWMDIQWGSTFTPGIWRYEACLRLDGQHADGDLSGYNAVIAAAPSVTIDGEEWLSDATVGGEEDVSTVMIYSPSFELTAAETCDHVWEEGLCTASCAKAGKQYSVCSVCGISKADDVPATGAHVMMTVHDEVNCYNVCRICGIVQDKEPHAFEERETTGNCGAMETLFVCTRCGFEKTAAAESEEAHQWSLYYVFTGDEHFRVCTVCGMTDEASAHEGTGVCAVCGCALSEDGRFTGSCTHGALKPSSDSPSDEESEENPDEMPEEPFEGLEWIAYVPASGNCAEGTAAHFRCIGCGQLFTAEDPEASLYEIRDGSVLLIPVEEEALIYSDGEHTYETDCDPACLVCGEARDVQHEYPEEWGGNGAQHFYECALCGSVKDIGNHELSDWITDEESTCKKAGIRHVECTVCGMVIVEEVYRKGHAFGEWTVERSVPGKAGMIERKCTECGEKEHFDLIPLNEGAEPESEEPTETTEEAGETEAEEKQGPKKALPEKLWLWLLLSGIGCIVLGGGTLVYTKAAEYRIRAKKHQNGKAQNNHTRTENHRRKKQ